MIPTTTRQEELTRSEVDLRSEGLWSALPAEIRLILPQEDAWALDPELREARMSLERRRRWKLAKLLGEGTDLSGRKVLTPSELQEKRNLFKLACAADPVFFVEHCIWTRDPEGRMGLARELPLLLFDYQKNKWLRPWAHAQHQKFSRLAHEKGRRVRATITRMAFEVWRMRFVPQSHSWVSTDKEEFIDHGEDWNSLFGKFRYFWRTCRRYYPWLFPDLPPHSEVNQRNYIRFPEWKDGPNAIDESCWGNELLGFLPSEVSGRGGAARSGFIDEAGWVRELAKFLDGIEDMTPDLTLASSPPPDKSHPFAVRVFDVEGYITNCVHWTMDPVKAAGIYWDDKGEWRGPHTKRWRSPAYDDALRTRTPQEVARNWDIDYLATAGARIFLNYVPDRVNGSSNTTDHTWDLWDPRLELQVWYDVGRGDPWSFLWVQIDWEHGYVNVVDYWMKNDVTVHWWVPLLLGWPWKSNDRWRTAPEAVRWKDAVPWGYREEEIAIIERWNSRRNSVGGRIKIMNGDFHGTTHGGSDLMSVEERLHAYGLFAQSASASHQMDGLIEKADEVMLRTRVSGRLVGMRPLGRWPSVDECFQFWRRRESTETSAKAPPMHDDYSHTGTAFVYGARWLPTLVPGHIGEEGQRIVDSFDKRSGRARMLGSGGDGDLGWL